MNIIRLQLLLTLQERIPLIRAKPNKRLQTALVTKMPTFQITVDHLHRAGLRVNSRILVDVTDVTSHNILRL
jgi:hypothetical protein